MVYLDIITVYLFGFFIFVVGPFYIFLSAVEKPPPPPGTLQSMISEYFGDFNEEDINKLNAQINELTTKRDRIKFNISMHKFIKDNPEGLDNLLKEKKDKLLKEIVLL